MYKSIKEKYKSSQSVSPKQMFQQALFGWESGNYKKGADAEESPDSKC